MIPIKECMIVAAIAGAAISLGSFGNRESFEQTERMEERVQSLEIQNSLSRHRYQSSTPTVVD